MIFEIPLGVLLGIVAAELFMFGLAKVYRAPGILPTRFSLRSLFLVTTVTAIGLATIVIWRSAMHG
jgi:hypothetical protein